MTGLRRWLAAAMALVGCELVSGCVMVGGSSRGGFFIWPGGLGLLVIIIIAFALMRRR